MFVFQDLSPSLVAGGRALLPSLLSAATQYLFLQFFFRYSRRVLGGPTAVLGICFPRLFYYAVGFYVLGLTEGVLLSTRYFALLRITTRYFALLRITTCLFFWAYHPMDVFVILPSTPNIGAFFLGLLLACFLGSVTDTFVCSRPVLYRSSSCILVVSFAPQCMISYVENCSIIVSFGVLSMVPRRFLLLKGFFPFSCYPTK